MDGISSDDSMSITSATVDSKPECELSSDSSVFMFDSAVDEDKLAFQPYSTSVTDDGVLRVEAFCFDSLSQYYPPVALKAHPPSNGSWPSVITEDDIRRIRKTYNLPESVKLRIPLDSDGADCNGIDEVTVFEAFFALGLREKVPSLIAEVANHFNISPGQLTPHSWRVLTAMQVFGELQNIKLGVEVVLYAYFLKAYELDSSRYTIQRRSSFPVPIVFELNQKVRKKTLYENNWQERFLFMHVGVDPGFPVLWFPRDTSKLPRCEEGRDCAFRAISYCPEKRSVSFLVSHFALEKSSIWGYRMSAFDASVGDDALALFKQVAAAVPAKADVAAPFDEQPAARASLKRDAKAVDKSHSSTRALKKKTLASLPGNGMLTNTDHSAMMADLNGKLFPRDREVLRELGYAYILSRTQAHHMEMMSVCNHVKSELDTLHADLHCAREDNLKLKRDLDLEIANRESARLTHDAEKESLKKEIATIKDHFESTKVGMAELQLDFDRQKQKFQMAVSATTIHNRWRMIQEYKNGTAHTWDAIKAERDYREIVTIEAQLDGKTAPVFPETYTDFGDGSTAPICE